MIIFYYQINFYSFSTFITQSLTQFLSTDSFSFPFLSHPISFLMADELIQGKSTSTILLSFGNFQCKKSQPFRQNTINAFSSSNFSQFPHRCRVCRISPPKTKQNFASWYFAFSSLSRSQVWIGFWSALLRLISSSEMWICGYGLKRFLMSQNLVFLESKSFLSSLSPHGISHTQSMPYMFAKCWINFMWPMWGGSNAPPQIAILLIIILLIILLSAQLKHIPSSCSFLSAFQLNVGPQAGVVILQLMQEAKKNDKYDFMAKVIIIGDSGVGKTNLITRFCENSFKDSYVATIGVDFKIKTICCGNRKYKLQIWDTAGQQRFKNITQAYYKGAVGIILTYSITDRSSFENIEKWITQIDNHAPSDVSKVLIATKLDLDGEREVSTEQGLALSRKFNLPLMEVSAKTGKNVSEGFDMLVQLIHDQNQAKGGSNIINTNKQIQIGKKEAIDKHNCSC